MIPVSDVRIGGQKTDDAFSFVGPSMAGPSQYFTTKTASADDENSRTFGGHGPIASFKACRPLRARGL